VEQLDSDESTILARLQDPTFDPRASVVLEEPPDPTDPGGSPPLTAGGQWAQPARLTQPEAAQAQLETDAPNKLVVTVKTPSPGLLVLSESYDPAWRATVDGRPARVYRADYAFRAVAVPAGEHTVTLQYASRAFQLGVLLSAVVLAVLLPLATRLWMRNPGPRLV
jgi:hypothetical protein